MNIGKLQRVKNDSQLLTYKLTLMECGKMPTT